MGCKGSEVQVFSPRPIKSRVLEFSKTFFYGLNNVKKTEAVAFEKKIKSWKYCECIRSIKETLLASISRHAVSGGSEVQVFSPRPIKSRVLEFSKTFFYGFNNVKKPEAVAFEKK
jgi:hypothetical protein